MLLSVHQDDEEEREEKVRNLDEEREEKVREIEREKRESECGVNFIPKGRRKN